MANPDIKTVFVPHPDCTQECRRYCIAQRQLERIWKSGGVVVNQGVLNASVSLQTERRICPGGTFTEVAQNSSE